MSLGITPPLIAGNLALDFINTQFGVGSDRHECLNDDHSVVEWLRQAGALNETLEAPPTGLVELARALREDMRKLIVSAREGRGVDPAIVNQVLERGRPIERLEWVPANAVFHRQTYRCDLTSESLLQPVAQALAELLTEEDLQLVKECQASDCVLLFHDQTKSHRRRWCSMASCGNRMKAAAHRARKSAT
ncbi:CGNR zinc finger domain-containing protein [Chromohalobacter sp. HP20-39]|uniref:CGNR zinc finger domain-containing protein n=1 Tax=Chromohalobacter sp. HP20-39 TaxID=3079306 RepID=UPI00294B1227|nr:ABATE domain-containing protein [Chromohalobacter sp. HP20-39]MDV6318252.1 ABATE domain-containing protein [Chromohalobacter sp. HP20-39]